MKIYNEKGEYTDEHLAYRWKLICDIHQQGIKTAASFIGVGAIATNNVPASLEALDKVRAMLVALQELKEEEVRQREALESSG